MGAQVVDGGADVIPITGLGGEPEGGWFVFEWVTGHAKFFVPGCADEVDLLTLVGEEPFIVVKDEKGLRVFLNVDQILAFRKL